MKTNFCLLYILLTIITMSQSCQAQPQQKGVFVNLVEIADGFTSPVGMACPDDGTGRIFVLEQGGKIKIVNKGIVNKTPFIDISSRLDGLNIAYSEKGLLGMAFHPDYKTNGRFFLYYSAPHKQKGFDHKSIVAEFSVAKEDPDRAIDQPIIILEILQPESNHNGGMLEFGPDGFLYIGTGDGGGANDEHGSIGNGQDKNTLLGKILRIDVDGRKPYAIPSNNPFIGKPGHRDEIYAYGLRNPWRFSFDKTTGNLFCGDVGQNKYEEINIIKKGGNYGWRIMEGYHCFNPSSNCNTSGLELPIDEYNHETGISICGGYMYRGKDVPGLNNYYVFGDWNGKLFVLNKQSDGTWKRSNPNVNGTGKNELNGKLNSMGEDRNGEIYLLTQKLFGPKSPTGVLLKVTQ
jgi:glucose/arabinose dehydrogenase